MCFPDGSIGGEILMLGYFESEYNWDDDLLQVGCSALGAVKLCTYAFVI